MSPIPTHVSEMWEYLKLPGGTGSRMMQVMGISSDGYVYAYNIDLENGDSGDDNAGEQRDVERGIGNGGSVLSYDDWNIRGYLAPKACTLL
ncbi:hypothetical protein DACRYDRAFT_110123 [Dacryopinax primogenitus]|uniref:Uncharacterized protein n=1 Tax=Dacryopinax primogenitus (strain DJM 731) TaxID=1858805 RepID=M5FQX0_DACPD|nr:uncharacterized protein DACRYDRAFT_110123 [Dacryopinax primogenitus]EJT99400.1 hypothetical protein DACRYDRAFT_110123 [Dacryopinax primogenitus]